MPFHLELQDRNLIVDPGSVLGVIGFGASEASVSDEAGVELPMPYLGPPIREVLRFDSPVERSESRGFKLSRTKDLLFAATVRNGDCLRSTASDVYTEAIQVAREAGYPHIIRMWNHFPSIHDAENGLERYRSFCAGRAAGFERCGYALGHDLPAASGVGTDGPGLLVMFIASRTPGRNIENPRQVSAFRYPERYGPRSPSFARATVIETGGSSQLFVSGTASIVGHRSIHAGNVEKQLDETMENIRLVVERATEGRVAALASLPSPAYRAYLRRPEDYEKLEAKFRDIAGPNAQAVWVRGDICREELLLEIELWSEV